MQTAANESSGGKKLNPNLLSVQMWTQFEPVKCHLIVHVADFVFHS